MILAILLLALPSVLALPSRFETRIARRAGPTCALDSALSCSVESTLETVDTCCVSTPGGAFLLTQFWNLDTGPSDTFTVHGLWPDYCNGSYPAFCDKNREYDNITAIMQASQDPQAASTLAEMNELFKSGGGYGTDESLQAHEWDKHGTCISTLEPKCYGSSYTPQQEVVTYFVKTMSLFKSLPTYDWLGAAGITPSTTQTYTLGQLQEASVKNHGFEAVWNCRNASLGEVWYGYFTRGNVESGEFVPTVALGKSNCPETGIKWLPKLPKNDTVIPEPTATLSSIQTPTSLPVISSTLTTSVVPTSIPTPTPEVEVGTSIINVLESTKNKIYQNTGCLIESGKWSVGAKCAQFKYTFEVDEFTLTSNGKSCGIANDIFSCSQNSSPYKFTINRFSNLINKSTSSSTLYATRTPSWWRFFNKSRAEINISTAEEKIAIRLVLA